MLYRFLAVWAIDGLAVSLPDAPPTSFAEKRR